MAAVMAAAFLQVLGGVDAAAEPVSEPASEGAASDERALAKARESGRPVEILARRGEHRTVRALPTGRIEVVEHLRPVRTRQGGGWVDIDTRLRASGSDVVPGATTVGLRLSGGGDGPLVRMTRAGRELSLTWPTKLPEPTLDGDTAVYQGVLGPDVDLRLRVEPEGFAHTFVVKTAEAAKDPRLANLAFKLDTKRLSIGLDATGGLKAKDSASAAEVFEAPAPVMWDSTQSAPSGKRRASARQLAEGPAEGVRTAPVRVAVAKDRLALTPDQQLLTSPDTKFPVYIDPVWQTNAAYAWGMVSSGYPNESYYKFNGNATEGLGRCLVSDDTRCVKDQTKRLFYRMKLPSIKGSYIQSAEFVAYETDAYNCDNKTSVQLWRTSGLTSSATWNNTKDNWGEHLASRDVAYCSRAPVEFGGTTLRSHVQDAVNKKYSTITFGLKAYNETSMAWWKRFADDAYLKIQYNRPPRQPYNESMYASPGTYCADKPQAKPINRLSTLYAYLHDPDSEDANKVQGEFALNWDAGDGKGFVKRWTSPLLPPLTTGTKRYQALPSTIPQKTLIAWNVRAYDGQQWGPWASDGAQHACYFYYDPAVPGDPTVTSTDYPSGGAWHGGVGESGTFTISDPAKVADRYDISLNGVAIKSIATVDGAARQVTLAPDRAGPNHLTVQAHTDAHQNAGNSTYEFWTNTGAEPAARFALDEAAGGTEVAAQTQGTAAVMKGGAALGGDGKVGKALTLNGATAYAETGPPVIDTSKSFTVSAWVRLDARDPERYYTVLSQEGTHKSAFYLRYDVGTKRWVFATPNTDSTATDDGWATTWSAQPAVFGEWTHLTGVYDQQAARLRLYVNGEVGFGDVPVTSAWRAGGGLQFGLAKWLGHPVDHLPGAIDDVKVYQRALSDSDARALADGTAPSGSGPKAHWALDEEAGSPRAYSPNTITASLHGGPTLGSAGQEGGALRLDGADDTAATSGPVINTNRSFAVAAWVWVDSLDSGRHLSVLSQDGDHRSGFYLKYDPVQRRWVFTRFAEDSDAADGMSYPSWSKQPAQAGAWTHLAGVWNADTKRMQLFVNGEPSEQSPEVASTWNATGALQIGRSLWQSSPTDFFPGAIDDVRVYDRILGAQEVGDLVKQQPALAARWKFNTDGAGEPAAAPVMTLGGGASIDQSSGFKYISEAGLLLNGSTAYAQTEAPPIKADESFTIAGWVYNIGRPEGSATVFSQAGANANAFSLRYVRDESDPESVGGWQLEMNNADQSPASPRIASHPAFNEGDWDHVAIAYDALRDRMSLYVNGDLHQSESGVSQEDQVLGFAASNAGLQIGRSKLGGAGGSEFWPGSIDDVWAYRGALTETQIGYLAGGAELATEDGP